LDRLVALAEGSPAAEVCGLLVERGAEVEAWPLTNVATSPGTAFEVAPRELLQALRRIEGTGDRLIAIFHSHLSGGADLSRRDLEGALAGEGPLWPGVAQLVVALEGGRVSRVRAHRWNGEAFEPTDLR
jgi:proteasome lid subunit RPN8/RPN11